MLPDDIVDNVWLDTQHRTRGGWGLDDDGIDYTVQAYVITIYRWRDETDDEYTLRMSAIERQQRSLEEHEKLEYLRLKARFENDDKQVTKIL